MFLLIFRTFLQISLAERTFQSEMKENNNESFVITTKFEARRYVWCLEMIFLSIFREIVIFQCFDKSYLPEHCIVARVFTTVATS